MTTKEFIKLLQEADPSGTAHIRMDDGFPVSVVLKEGYYDGPYEYIDEEGNYVYSARGTKVDIYCMSIWNFVEIQVTKDINISLEDVKKKFKFELEMYVNKDHVKDRVKNIYEKVESAYNEIIKIYKKS